jgi:hypothetical protein
MNFRGRVGRLETLRALLTCAEPQSAQPGVASVLCSSPGGNDV